MARLPDPLAQILIGATFALILFGIVVFQTWNYFNNFNYKDNGRLKAFVASLFMLDFAATIFLLIWLYRVLVTTWADNTSLMQIYWTLVTGPVLLGIIGPLVITFFALRIHALITRWWVPGVICVLAFASFAGGIASGVAGAKMDTFADLEDAKASLGVCLVPAAVANIIITGAMSHYLFRRKDKFSLASRTLDTMIQVSVQNGLVTSLLSSAQAILFLCDSGPYYLALSFVMPKLYANMALSALNSRKIIDVKKPEVLAMPSGDYASNAYMPHRTVHETPGVFVNVETTRAHDTDLKDGWGGNLTPSEKESPPSSSKDLPVLHEQNCHAQ
ncbi:uncharacterized protein EV420DRAFT_587198 [Desarmillaria tabescens]|uniref:DUF6534 domain-containing protein n=1 Tax=Armillaria tabescens TaxID=1929756 RepID=A0AA39K8H7_ARMTA|nr:uncharacterized protein EV420DRAFT_587198 [Desarmillaria tabescens]KAK0455184.1 hypothetical protein EV420DRAFT_587198 [Desarmillaria tabescens]